MMKTALSVAAAVAVLITALPSTPTKAQGVDVQIGRGEAGVVRDARVPAFGRAVRGVRSYRWAHGTDITASG